MIGSPKNCHEGIPNVGKFPFVTEVNGAVIAIDSTFVVEVVLGLRFC